MKRYLLFVLSISVFASHPNFATLADEEIAIKVKVIGIINDTKFTMEGDGSISPERGDAEVNLRYSEIPKNWNALNYSDPLVLLAGYREVDGGKNFGSLATGYDAKATYDFGNGMMLRKTATVKIAEDGLDAVYSIAGTADVGEIVKANEFNEHLVPVDGGYMGIGLASWTTKSGEKIEALVSTRYKLHFRDDVRESSLQPQVRSFSVDAKLKEDGRTFHGRFKTNVGKKPYEFAK